jgi:hydroxysqualene synthase
VSVDHYENFPVASVLCPPAIRPAVVAIYHFARTADDIADEGCATPEQRQLDLRAYRADLDALYTGTPPSARWPAVFARLDEARRRFDLPRQPLADLLDAFLQDTANPRYPTREALLDYCRRSANPVGRLLLHLYGIGDARSQSQADDICTALQLINFWQDLSVDHPRGRVYLPESDAAACGVDLGDPAQLADNAATQRLVACLCEWAEQMMRRGAPLALRVPGRAGWELRLVVQGGLRVLARIRALEYRTLGQRPRLRAWDVPRLLWGALSMRAPQAAAGIAA